MQEFVRQFEEPQHMVVFTDSDSTGNANKKLQETMNTKNLTETIITIYNTKQLVDNMNKNKVLHIIFLALVDEDLFQLIKEKFDLKAEVEDDFIKEKKDNIIEMDKSIDDENVDDTFNMKECDAMIIETNNKKKSRRRCTILIVGVLYRS